MFLEGIDKQLLGQVAAKFRGLRKPEPTKEKVLNMLMKLFVVKLVKLQVNNLIIQNVKISINGSLYLQIQIVQIPGSIRKI